MIIEKTLKGLFLAFILYLLFLLPSVRTIGIFYEEITFSIQNHLIRLFTYTIPILFLVYYLLYKRPKKPFPKFTLTDLIIFTISLIELVSIGFVFSLMPKIFSTEFVSPQIMSPDSFSAWIVMIISCLGTGYLEESFFRIYLLQKLEEANIGKIQSILFSTLLFSLCHIYLGIWGVLNAIFAGFFLCLIYIKYKSFHGIAFAHTGYNIFVYTMQAAGLTT